jgi:hypothetical protein
VESACYQSVIACDGELVALRDAQQVFGTIFPLLLEAVPAEHKAGFRRLVATVSVLMTTGSRPSLPGELVLTGTDAQHRIGRVLAEAFEDKVPESGPASPVA